MVGQLRVSSNLFVVLYSSCTCWTALLSRFMLGKHLATMQWVGIVCVCAGLAGDATISMFNEPEGFERQEGLSRNFGICAVLAGSFLHSLMFCMCEHLLTASIPASVVCSTMGTGESMVLVLYHLGLLGPGTSIKALVMTARIAFNLLLIYTLLVVTCALHAWSFFLHTRHYGRHFIWSSQGPTDACRVRCQRSTGLMLYYTAVPIPVNSEQRPRSFILNEVKYEP